MIEHSPDRHAQHRRTARFGNVQRARPEDDCHPGHFRLRHLGPQAFCLGALRQPHWPVGLPYAAELGACRNRPVLMLGTIGIDHGHQEPALGA